MRPSKRAQKINEQLAAQRGTDAPRALTLPAGSHNPASECECGTWRTPGQTHTKGDTGLTPKGTGAPQCNK